MTRAWGNRGVAGGCIRRDVLHAEPRWYAWVGDESTLISGETEG